MENIQSNLQKPYKKESLEATIYISESGKIYG